jgi:uncharacterized protein YgiB involved in biofilm formation
MKKSRKIALTLLASTCIFAGGCGDEQVNTQRNLYASKDKCAQDWGDEECEQTTNGYYGPHYYYSRGRPFYFPRNGSDSREVESHRGFLRSGPGMPSSSASSVVSSTKTIRGGFGRISGFHSGGG